jgi:hypothetical protein
MKKLAFALLTLASLCTTAQAQKEAASAREFFRLDFTLKETENGKLVNTRSFQMMAPADEASVSSIRSGDKIAVTPSNGTITYMDVGVSIDVHRIHRNNDELTLDISAETSSADSPTLIRQTRLNSTVVIPIRKPAVIFSADGPSAKRQLQVEVTATPLH